MLPIVSHLLPPFQLPRRPRFTGGGDLDTLSLYRLLLAGTGLAGRLPPRRGGLGDRDCESRPPPLRTGGGDLLSCLALLGGGERESYEGDRLYCLGLSRAPSLTEELLRRLEPGPAFPRGRPRRGGLPENDLCRFLAAGGDARLFTGEGDRSCESRDRLRLSRGGGEGDRPSEA